MPVDVDRFAPRQILPLRPEPIQTIVANFDDGDGLTYTTVVRRWTTVAAGRCRLCRRCAAKAGVDQQAVCVVTVIGSIEPAAAPQFSQDD